MPLNLVSLLPHSPLLIPEIGRSNHAFLDKTSSSYAEIGQKLKDKEIDTLIIVSPHGLEKASYFTINVGPEMLIDLKDFGFMATDTSLNGDAILADKIQSELRPDCPLELISEKVLDNGSGVPLYLLRPYRPEMKIVVIYPSTEASYEDVVSFGAKLGEIANKSQRSIALIASGDMSHRLKKKSPAGYSPKGAKFDNKLIEYLSDAPTAIHNILRMDPKLIETASECGFRPLLTALGAVSSQPWEAKIMSYQTDFGVGYLSLDFVIN